MIKRYALLVLVAALGLMVAAPATAATNVPSKGHLAKGCKKKHGKKKCKKPAPTPPVRIVQPQSPTPPVPVDQPPVDQPPPPAPLALTEAEVSNRIDQVAAEHCSTDSECVDYGHTTDATGALSCDSKTTYGWSCYGFTTDEIQWESFMNLVVKCDFREIVERDGYDGITSQLDLSFAAGGWSCPEIDLPPVDQMPPVDQPPPVDQAPPVAEPGGGGLMEDA